MAYVVPAPIGLVLPSKGLFDVAHINKKSGRLSSVHFWSKGHARNTTATTEGSGETHELSEWLDDEQLPALSDEDDDDRHSSRNAPTIAFRKLRKLRQIAFRTFSPRAASGDDSTTGRRKDRIVISTEFVTQHSARNNAAAAQQNSKPTIFTSWKFKSRDGKTQFRKLMAAVRRRVSSKSPVDERPKTWAEFHRMYASEEIDIRDPPFPVQEKGNPHAGKWYSAPKPNSEPRRQLVLNRLGLFGDRHFDPSEEAAAEVRAKAQLAEQLEKRGRAPAHLHVAWQDQASLNPTDEDDDNGGVEQTRAIIEDAKKGELTAESLEQHPVFRRLVQECRAIFGTAIGMITVLDHERLVFLAETGLGGLRDLSRDVSICAHTILSGRKGLTILDTTKDWRFESVMKAQEVPMRFYAGVPLLAPNLDGTREEEEHGCAIGTLCVVDYSPRESFGIEERKQLIYMAEYARRELEVWFLKKMEKKIKKLDESRERWEAEVQNLAIGDQDQEALLTRELCTPIARPIESDRASITTSMKNSIRWRQANRLFTRSPMSHFSSPPTTPSSSHSPTSLISPKLQDLTSQPGLFDESTIGINPRIQSVFDLATKLIGDALKLSLVYLVAVVPHRDSQYELGRTKLISGYKVPLPLPIFDVALHLRALRAPEGGLLYQNPDIKNMKDINFDNLNQQQPFASAVLLGVGKEIEPNQGGFILAGFTQDPKRVFGGEDIKFMQQFANQLNKWTCQINF